jgi:cytochrome c-type biogenesis protein
MGAFKLKFLSKLHFNVNLNKFYKDTGIFRSFLVGLFFALACSHCFGALLYSILIYAGTTGSVSKGIIIMSFFFIGLSIPYILTSLALSNVLEFLRNNRRKIIAIQVSMGFILLIFGVFTISNNFSILMNFLGKILPYKLPFGLGV